jgi:TIR domain
MREVFLSHASHDQLQAAKLRDFLTTNGIPVWFSPHHIRGAQQWQDEIGAALARCRWFAVMLTPHSIKSMWVKRELSYALKEKRYEDRIVPLLFKKCDISALSWTLPLYQIIDFTRDYDAACQQLLRIWKKPPRSLR